jgi:hypothetical protein
MPTWRLTPTPLTPATRASRTTGPAPRTCPPGQRPPAPSGVARRPDPRTRAALAGRRRTTRRRRTGPGSVPRTLCRAWAALGHVRRARGPGPVARAQGQGSSAPRRRAARGPRVPPIRAALDHTPTRRDPDRPRPPARAPNPRGRVTRGKDIRGIRGRDIRVTSKLRGTRDKTSAARHRAGPGRRRASRQLRSGRSRDRTDRLQAARDHSRRSSRGLASTGPAGRVPARDQSRGRAASRGLGNHGHRKASRDTGSRILGQGRPATPKASSQPGRVPASPGRGKDLDRRGQALTVKGSLARDRTRLIPTAPASTAVRKCPGPSVSTHGTRDPGRPPGHSKHLAGRLDRDRSRDRTPGPPGRGRPRGLRRDHTAPATATPAAGRRRHPGMALTHGPPGPGRPRDPSSHKAGQQEAPRADQATATPGRGRRIRRLDLAGHLARGSSARP